jgi:taurine dioxygenase
MAGYIGAEITGIDLSQPADKATIDAIRQALLDYKVVFFRDQRLGHAEHVSFARQFGPLTAAHPFVEETPAGFPEVLSVDYQKTAARYGVTAVQRQRTEAGAYSGWHSDLTPMVNPPAICILRAETVPAHGGDTTWTNLVAAYSDMSSPLQRFLGELSAEHRYLAGYQPASDDRDSYKAKVSTKPLAALHPVVRVHPETGEQGLFVNPLFTSLIAGFSARESQHILDLLFEQIARPAYTVRFRWSAGSVAMWDNRATAHLAPTDLHEPGLERVLHRVSVVGDVPVAPNGRSSSAIAGDPWLEV